MITPHPWTHYSNLLSERILRPRNVGSFDDHAGALQEMRVAIGKASTKKHQLLLYLVVDETDGIIADAKFQAFGESALIGAADILCEIILRKNYSQAQKISADMIDKKLRDFDHVPAFPNEVAHHLNLVLETLDDACEKCHDIPITDPSYSPPVPSEIAPSGEYPNWEALSHAEKLELINQVISEEIQPYIELDAGGIEVLSFNEDREIVIAYQGACTTCPSSTGATLNAIQQILRSKVHPELVVKPDLSLLSF